MSSNRRDFLASASALTFAAFCRDVTFANGIASPALLAAGPAANSELSGKALLAKMKWFNEPASAKQSGDQLIVITKPKTDYWCKTFYDYVTDSGHFFYLPLIIVATSLLESRVSGKYAALYDQPRTDGAHRCQQLDEVRP